MSESTIFDNTIAETVQPCENVSWQKHGLYRFGIVIWQFITGPERKKKHKDNRFRFIAESLVSNLSDHEVDSVIIKATRDLLHQHRTIEDTEARRRLEKWACVTIIVYLVCVLILVVLNGLSRIIWPHIFIAEGFISDTVMYVILSTTTINIIGLGIIVLKGHFPQNDTKKEENTSINISDAQNRSDNLHQS